MLRFKLHHCTKLHAVLNWISHWMIHLKPSICFTILHFITHQDAGLCIARSFSPSPTSPLLNSRLSQRKAKKRLSTNLECGWEHDRNASLLRSPAGRGPLMKLVLLGNATAVGWNPIWIYSCLGWWKEREEKTGKGRKTDVARTQLGLLSIDSRFNI